MPSFSDSIFLFILALLLFGPKKLPVLARELGKWIGEFRRASNEFKMQMEEELRQSEQADRQKQIAAMEAAAPAAPLLEEPQRPHLPATDASDLVEPESSPAAEKIDGVAPLPIAVSGELSIMPPSTGLPVPQTKASPLGGLLDSIPGLPDENATSDQQASNAPATTVPAPEPATNGN
jgi:sec-independent protein translocase protein TatB